MADAPQIIRRPRQSPQSEVERMLSRMIAGITHGRVTLVLQDGMVIQVNREESVRLGKQNGPRETGA